MKHPVFFRRSVLLFALILVLAVSATQAAQAGRLRDWLSARTDNADKASSTTRDGLVPGDSVHRDVPYGLDANQKIDVYVPPHAQKAPLIVMVHGGAWVAGDKANDTVVKNKGAHYLSRGFIFISVNNRLLPAADPVEQTKDVAKALGYIQKHAQGWGGDASRLVLMGHSAGGHLVAFLAANPAQPALAGVTPWRGTVTLDSAAMDVERIMKAKHFPLYDRAFGQDVSFWRAASPINQIAAQARPMLMICSTRREEESCGQMEAFAMKAASLGISATVLPQDKTHGEITVDLGADAAYTAAVDAFIDDALK